VHRPCAWLAPAEVELKRLVQSSRAVGLKRRLEGRGKDSAETIARRMASAREEISHVLEFEYIIINESFDNAVVDLIAVVRAARLSRERQLGRLEKLKDEFK